MIAATVLSAGDSTRMGKPKALLQLHGLSFLATILAKLRDAGVDHGFVVLGSDRDKIMQNHDLGAFQVVVNSQMAEGPTGSVKSVLRMINDPTDGLLVWPVDMPHVRTETVRSMLRSQSVEPIVVPVYNGARGHPILVKKNIFREILHLPPGGTVRDVVRADPSRVHRVQVDDAAVLQSINTPEDYRRLIAESR